MVRHAGAYSDEDWHKEEYSWDSRAPLYIGDFSPYANTLSSAVWKGETWLPAGWYVECLRSAQPVPGWKSQRELADRAIPTGCSAWFTELALTVLLARRE